MISKWLHSVKGNEQKNPPCFVAVATSHSHPAAKMLDNQTFLKAHSTGNTLVIRKELRHSLI